MSEALLLAVCVALDWIVGDPPAWPHPVRAVGALAARLEPWAQRSPLARGALVTVVVAAGAALGAHALISPPWGGKAFALYLGFAGLALGSLVREARRVRRALACGDVDTARRLLAFLVSRETAHLDEAGVARGLAETLAENTTDGFVAPLFWLTVGGVPGLWAYKAVSTLDSMWGYRTPRFERLGKCAARMDDLAAYLPARLTAWAMAGVAWIWGRRISLWSVARQARALESPNAGWPMAAAAAAIGAGMGGEDRYAGQVKRKPRLGPAGVPWTVERLEELERLVVAASFGCAATAVVWKLVV